MPDTENSSTTPTARRVLCAIRGGKRSAVTVARAVEIAVAEYIDWYNHRRLHGEIGHVPPAEYEAAFWDSQPNHYLQTPVLTEAGTT